MVGDGELDPRSGFLRDMAAQSARAREFDRRMRWLWLRRDLEGDPVLPVLPEPVTAAVEPGPEVIDLRAAPEVSASEGPAVPHQRH